MGLLLVYAVARVLQLVETPVPRLPVLLVVMLHVVPAALFACIHGAITYGRRGMLVFAALCLGVGSGFESLGLRTGFPFGHYRFTDVMGPKILQLPVLLALAYLGMGYLSWVLAVAIVELKMRPREKKIIEGNGRKSAARGSVFLLPLVASGAMVAWDLAMDPVWATMDRAWIWRDGGPLFGVPLSNYFGWFLTVFTFYTLFAIYLRGSEAPRRSVEEIRWRLPMLFYAVSALGNLLLLPSRGASIVVDPTGKAWRSADILGACAFVSLFGMLPFPLMAWLRLRQARRAY